MSKQNTRLSLEKIEERIANYPSGYPTPKYLLFMKYAIENGFQVSLHEAKTTRSKYVFVYKGKQRFKVRFSNHLPNPYQELTKDCNFFVGVCNSGTTTTRQAWFAMLEFFRMEQTHDSGQYRAE